MHDDGAQMQLMIMDFWVCTIKAAASRARFRRDRPNERRRYWPPRTDRLAIEGSATANSFSRSGTLRQSSTRITEGPQERADRINCWPGTTGLSSRRHGRHAKCKAVGVQLAYAEWDIRQTRMGG